MHLRKLVLACGLASFALSNFASALGLGEVKLKSALNQPLVAEVQLLDARDLSAEQIIASLASASDFERNGVDRLYFYTEFQFEVVMGGPSGPVIRITTPNPVREPYLNFLLEVRWTAGRLLREYTVLVDLPTFDHTVPKAVQAPESSQSKPSASKKNSSPAPVVEPSSVHAAETASDIPASEVKPDIIAEQERPSKKSKISSGTYGPIGAKDTLWDIANAARPDSSVSVHQTMLAIQRLNPDAFIRNNINLIKKGQILRLPDVAEINNVSKADAVNQVNSQISQWSSGATTETSGLGAQLDASKHSDTARREPEQVSGRVKLEAPVGNGKSNSGQGSGANKGSGRALDSELASALEELERAKSEKTEMSSRVHDLEEQVKTMQRLVDVSNEKLRAMQLAASKEAEKTAEPKPANLQPASSAAPVEEPKPSVASSAPAQQETSSAAASSQPVSVPPKKHPLPTAAKPPVAPPKTLVDKLMDNVQWVGLGTLGVLGAAGGGIYYMRRRKEQEEEEARRRSFEPDPMEDDEALNFAGFAEDNNDDKTVIDNRHKIAEDHFDEEPINLAEQESAIAETGDVVGEADIYIAYGKYDQAEDMLLNGLHKDPSSADIRLKLLEVYSQTHNVSEFDKHYAAILPYASNLMLNRASELRAAIPDAGEFLGDGESFSENYQSDFDLNLADEPTSEHAAQTMAAEDDAEDFRLDLDLDDDSLDSKDLLLSSTKYDMDMDDSAEPKSTSDGSPTLDDNFLGEELEFELPDDADLEGQAEDLSHITSVLDSLDDQDSQKIGWSTEDSVDTEFKFDSNDNIDSLLEEPKKDGVKLSQLNVIDENIGDDFNLEMDFDDVDLAALDQEIDSLDAKLDGVDGEAFGELPADAVEDTDDFAIESLAQTTDESGSSLDIADLDFNEAEPEASQQNYAIDEELDLDEEFNFDVEGDGELPALDIEEVDNSLAGNGEQEFELDDDLLLDADTLTSDSLVGEEPDFTLQDQEFALEEPRSVADEALLSLEDEDVSLVDEPLAELADVELDEKLDEVVELDDAEALQSLAPESSKPLADATDDDVFEQALSEFSSEDFQLETAEISDDDIDSDLDFMADADEAATKLDLARAYIDMGDNEGARDILSEVAQEGSEQQRQEAVDLLNRLEA